MGKYWEITRMGWCKILTSSNIKKWEDIDKVHGWGDGGYWEGTILGSWKILNSSKIEK